MKRNINGEIKLNNILNDSTKNKKISSSLNFSLKRKFNDIDLKLENNKKEKNQKIQETENDLFKWYIK